MLEKKQGNLPRRMKNGDGSEDRAVRLTIHESLSCWCLPNTPLLQSDEFESRRIQIALDLSKHDIDVGYWRHKRQCSRSAISGFRETRILTIFIQYCSLA